MRGAAAGIDNAALTIISRRSVAAIDVSRELAKEAVAHARLAQPVVAARVHRELDDQRPQAPTSHPRTEGRGSSACVR